MELLKSKKPVLNGPMGGNGMSRGPMSGGHGGGGGDFNAFRQAANRALSKLSEQSTASTGLAEIRGLIEDNVGDGEIGVLINLLGETNEHQKLLTKKEQLKVFSLIAEALEERTIEFFPRIVQVLQKKIKESCNISELFHPIGDALGAVVEHSLKNVALNQSLNIVDYAFNVFINALIKDGANNKAYQIGCATCLTRLMQTSPLDCLIYYLSTMTQRLLDIIKDAHCKAVACVLEALLSLILAVEDKFYDYALPCLPIIVENVASSDWNVRKLCIDILYTLGVLMPTVLHCHKGNLLEILNECRSDKIKHVRDAALVAIDIIKEFPDDEDNNAETTVPEDLKKSGSRGGPPRGIPSKNKPKFMDDGPDSPNGSKSNTLNLKKAKKEKEKENTANFPAKEEAPAQHVVLAKKPSTTTASSKPAAQSKFVKPKKTSPFDWNVEIVAKSPPRHIFHHDEPQNEHNQPENNDAMVVEPPPVNNVVIKNQQPPPSAIQQETAPQVNHVVEPKESLKKTRRDDVPLRPPPDERPLPTMKGAYEPEIRVADPPPQPREREREHDREREKERVGGIPRDRNIKEVYAPPPQIQQPQPVQVQQLPQNLVSISEFDAFKSTATGEVNWLRERVSSLEGTVRELVTELRETRNQISKLEAAHQQLHNNFQNSLCPQNPMGGNGGSPSGFYYGQQQGPYMGMKPAPNNNPMNVGPGMNNMPPPMMNPYYPNNSQPMSQDINQIYGMQQHGMPPPFGYNQNGPQMNQPQQQQQLGGGGQMNAFSNTGTSFRNNFMQQSQNLPQGFMNNPNFSDNKPAPGFMNTFQHPREKHSGYDVDQPPLEKLGGLERGGSQGQSHQSPVKFQSIEQVLQYLNVSGNHVDKLDDESILNILEILINAFVGGYGQEDSVVQWLHRIFELDFVKIPLDLKAKLKLGIQRNLADEGKMHDISFQLTLQRILKYLP